MFRGKPIVVLIFVLMLCLTTAVSAQEGINGTLTSGQPSIGFVQPGTTLRYAYTLADARGVSLQAIGDAMQPTVSIVRDGAVVAAQPNPDGVQIVSLNAFLSVGTYIIEVGSANSTTGPVVLVVQSETPITAQTLSAGAAVSGDVNPDAPIALYSFSALGEPAYLYYESGLVESGANVRVVNTASDRVSGMIGADVTGLRLRVPAGSVAYQVEVLHSGSGSAEPFTLCLSAVSSGGGCETGAVIPPAQTQEVVPGTGACTVTPAFAGGANIRQSASADTIILGALPGGATAEVIGIAPNGSFYNIRYNNIEGWIALSAITANGDCTGVPTVNPPAFIVPPTETPVPPTHTPVPPTPTLAPPTLTPTQAGPCLITMTGAALVYTEPNAIPDYIYDQVQAGYELIPVGRLADNSFWRTNYASSWIQTSHFGSVANVTGDCSGLPVVSP